MKSRINCQTYVQPELLDAVVAELEEIEEVEDYLTPLEEHIQNHIDTFFYGANPSKVDGYRDDTNFAFKNLISTYFDQERLTQAEVRLFKSIIANICIEISIRESRHPLMYLELLHSMGQIYR